MEKEVVAISKKENNYFLIFDDDTKIRVDYAEFQRVKRMLSKGAYLFLNVNEESDSIC